MAGMFCAPMNPKGSLLFSKLGIRLGNGNLGDLIYGLPLFGYVAIISLFLSLVFIAILTFFARCLTWILLIIVALFMIGLGSVFILSFGNLQNYQNVIVPLHIKYIEYFANHQILSILIGILLILIGLFLFFIICKYKKQINIAIPLVSIASRSSLKNVLLIFLSVFVLLL